MSVGHADQRPAIVITRGDPRSGDPGLNAEATELYAAAVHLAGGEPVLLYATSDAAVRSAALAGMAGLVLSGGADLAPERYGQAPSSARDVEPARDELELDAWLTAEARGLPVLGICRGLQAINVFSGGRLTQHVEGHDGPGWRQGPPLTHRLRVASGSQLARILRSTNPMTFVIPVNSSHHQAVRGEDLAPSLVASAWAPAADGELVEGLEGRDPRRLVIAVQCHPERTESTPPEFARLFRFFVDAARHYSHSMVAGGFELTS